MPLLAAVAALLIGLGAALLSAPAAPAAAHPADMYYQIHTIELAPDGIRAEWSISPGTLLSYLVWNDADLDGSDAVDSDEALAWAAPRVDDLFLVVDGTQYLWEITGVTWPDSLIDFEVGNQTVLIDVYAPWPDDLDGLHTLAFYNHFEEFNSTNWFYLSAADGLGFYTPEQQNGVLLFDVQFPGTVAPADAPPAGADSGAVDAADGAASDTPAGARTLRTYWDSGTPTLLAGGTPITPEQAKEESASSRLTELVAERELSPGFLLTALAISLGLGAIHALTPGHGKALVGAYLVGSRGTMRHAIALGSVVTLTHTGSVLAFGLVALAASRYFVPDQLFPLLEIASGLLIVGLGGILLWRRFQGWRSVRDARQRQARRASLQAQVRAEAAQVEDQRAREAVPATRPARLTPASASSGAGDAGGAGSGGSVKIAINQPLNVNTYNDVLPGEKMSLGSVNWRSLVALGVSGGMVPCPDAIAILLVAVAINRIVLGLSMIVAFSLGLAAILTAIGIAMVRSQRLLSRFSVVERAMPALPVVSAVIVTGLGLALTISAVQRGGYFDDSDESAKPSIVAAAEREADDLREGDAASDAARAFRLEASSLLYLRPDEGNRYQVVRTAIGSGDTVPVTEEPFGVWDYQLSPDEQRIVYAAPQEFGGSDIWTIGIDGSDRRHLLSCPESSCMRAQWAPDGTRIIYEKMDLPSPTNPMGVTTLWWLDLASGERAPVFQDTQLPSYNATWSPDGQWLSFVSPASNNIQLYNLSDGRQENIASQTGTAAIWHPAAAYLLLTDVYEVNEQFFTHLYRLDIETGERRDLSGESAQVGDNWAAWSPDGERLAVVRREYAGPDAALGDRIWLMRSDGSDARAITTESDIAHGTPVWSPDGRYLAYQRYPLAGSLAKPGLWVLDTDTGDLMQIAPKGNWPTWIY